MADKKEKNIFDRIWDFFASVKLAIVILIIIAVTSIIGTIIEQNVEPAKNIKFLAGIFGDNIAPTLYNIFIKLDFMDMYHSWWFSALLVLFSINLTVCSIEKFPLTWKIVKAPVKPLAEKTLNALPLKKDATVKTNIKTARDAAFNALSALKYSVFEETEENGIQLYTEKGNYSRLGVYIVHLSIILIFAGAIIGARFGFDGYVNIPEGSATSFIYTHSGEKIPLGFTVKCNWYRTDFYKDSDTPQEFSSELVIYDENGEAVKKVIEVNDPLTYKGITFYQSSYGFMSDVQGDFKLKIYSGSGREQSVSLRLGESFDIPDTKIKGTIMNFSPALGRDPNTGQLVTYADTIKNPAVAIKFENTDSGEKKEFTGWILNRYPETGSLPGGHRIEFQDYFGVEYTGLQVSKDPGIIIIYIACVIMTIGLYASFFMSHRKLWIRLMPEVSGKTNSVRITIGGSASKNRLALERQIENLLSDLSKELESNKDKTGDK